MRLQLIATPTSTRRSAQFKRWHRDTGVTRLPCGRGSLRPSELPQSLRRRPGETPCNAGVGTSGIVRTQPAPTGAACRAIGCESPAANPARRRLAERANCSVPDFGVDARVLGPTRMAAAIGRPLTPRHGSQAVERAPDSKATPVQAMEIRHRCGHVRVARSSWTVRMSCPLCSKCVANECRLTWGPRAS
jgi:hypothetical protein